MRNHKQFVQILAFALAALMLLSLILGLIPKAEAASSSEIKQQINALQSINALQQQINDLGYRMDSCCCKLQTQILQSQYDASLRENMMLKIDKSNVDQSAYLLGILGNWVPKTAAFAA